MRLRMHPIIGFEELAREGDEFGIGRMIQGLYRTDALRQIRAMFGQVVLELRLGIAGARDEDRARVRERLDHPPEKFRVHALVAASGHIRFVLLVMAAQRAHYSQIRTGHIDMEYLGFVVIHPDDDVILIGHDVALSFLLVFM
jgi:hypothetical protein